MSIVVSVENLKALIKKIAQCHAIEISNNSEKSEGVYEFNADDIAAWFDLPEAFNKATVTKQIETLNSLLRESILVKNQNVRKLVPLAYEPLSLIFSQTDERFRQQYFHELIELYYKELYGKINNDVVPKKTQFDKQVKLLLPIVKFEVLRNLIQNGGNKNQQLVTELQKNISNYFNFPRINQEDIYAVLKNKFNSNSFELISYEFVALKERNGHLGDYFYLKIQVKSGEIFEEVNLFAKFLCASTPEIQSFIDEGICEKEAFFYMTFIPKLKELGFTDLTDFAPNCYFCRMDDVMIMDDMNAIGFVGLTPNTRLEHDALELAVRQLAKLHACSLIMEEFLSKQEGKKIFLCDIYPEYLREILFQENSRRMKHLTSITIKNILFFASQFPEVTGKYSEAQLKAKAENGWKILFQKLKKSKEYRNVICHGDVYVANMLFNFDQNKHCRAVAIIDFQILRYCPPAQDLLFFLYQNAFKTTLDTHKTQLIDEYYNSLSNYLDKFNLDIAQIYPREMFDESIKYMKSEAIFHALYYSPMQMMDPKVRERAFQDPEQFQKMKNDPLEFFKMGMQGEDYRQQFKGLIEEFIELCDNGDI